MGNGGSGKTYFWNQFLKQIADEKKLKTATISLYGISDIEMLDRKLRKSLVLPTFTALEKTERKDVAFVHTVGSGIAKFVEGLSNVKINDIIQDIAIDAYIDDKIVICFDDLERAHMDYSLVLGYINNLIENKSAKVVILGNESEIINFESKKSNESGNSKNYLTIKEKCIRWTFNLEPDVSTIFDVFNVSCNSKLKEFMGGKKDYICKLFRTHKILNFRTMKFYFDVLERIYPKIFELDEEIKKEILFYTFICVAESATGKLNNTTIELFKRLRADINGEAYQKQMASYMGKENAEKVETPISDYWGKYFTDKTYPYREYYSIADFVVSGNFNEDNLSCDIIVRNNDVAKSEEDIIFEKITTPYFRSYSNEDFIKDINSFIEYVKEGKYSIYKYKMIAYWLAVYSTHGFVKLNSEDLIKMLKEGMRMAVKMEEENINRQAFNMALEEYNDDEYKNIIEPIEEELKFLHQQILSEKTTEDAKKLYNAILDKTENAENQISSIFDKNKSNKNFLLEIDADKLSEVLQEAMPNNIQIFKFELWKYLSGGVFFPIYPQILQLAKSLRNKLAEGKEGLQNKPVSKFNLSELIEVLDEKLIPALENNKTIPME